jgi:hypothetical protein
VALVEFDEFMDSVLAEVRLAPEDLAIQKLREIICDFCQHTRAWQADCEPQTIQLGVATYTVAPPAEAEPCAIEYMAVDDVPVIPKSVEWFDRMIPTWRTRDADDFRYFTQLTRKTFTFPGMPTQNGTADGLTYRLSLKPGPESTEVDEDVWNEWSDVLAMGAKAELLVMDGERWANVKRGGDYRLMYRKERTNARIRVQRAYGNAETQWVSPYKFAGR